VRYSLFMSYYETEASLSDNNKVKMSEGKENAVSCFMGFREKCKKSKVLTLRKGFNSDST
jgi:hypothetical protein